MTGSAPLDAPSARAGLARVLTGSFLAFVALQGALYGAYGLESPFLPSFLGERGLSPAEIGFVLAAGTGVRLLAGPVAGGLADRYAAPRAVLGLAGLGAGLVSFGYLGGDGFGWLLGVSMLHSVFIAALAPLADALTLAAAARERSFAYGWVRGAGSAAFVLGTLGAGQLVGRLGLSSVIVASGALFAVMGLAVAFVPPAPSLPGDDTVRTGLAGMTDLLKQPLFRRIVLVAALVIGSHALNDAFAVIRWREAGIGSGTISVLWSEAVLSEVAMFVVVGPWLLARLSPARAAMLAAGLGVVRWGVMASTTAVPILALTQPLHGFTFALLHLTNMRLIEASVPTRLAGSAQTLYGTLGLGIASALLTGTAGLLYGALGASAFWVMAGLCALALPLAGGLHRDEPPGA